MANREVSVATYVTIVIPPIKRRRNRIPGRDESSLAMAQLGDPPRVLIVKVHLDRVDRLDAVD